MDEEAPRTPAKEDGRERGNYAADNQPHEESKQKGEDVEQNHGGHENVTRNIKYEGPFTYHREQDLQGADEDLIHFESELMKYRPGLSTQYVIRWCQATPTHFNYYKSHWSANCWLSKPLMSIPFACIQSIHRVIVKAPGNRRKIEVKTYQFEIFLKKDVDVSSLSKSLDYSAYETRCMSRAKKSVCRNLIKDFATFPHTKQNSGTQLEYRENRKQTTPNLTIDQRPDARERCKSGLEESLKFSGLKTPERIVRDGHLMRTPSTYSKSRELTPNQYSSLKRSQEVSTSVEKRDEFVEEDGILFINKRQQQSFIEFKERYGKELEMNVTTEEISTKNPSGWIPTLSGLDRRIKLCVGTHTWTNREREWFVAESRFLFACDDVELCNKWVLLLNWILPESKRP